MATNILNGKRFIDIMPEDVPHNDQYCVALTGSDGMVMPESRLSEYFDGINAAFAALPALQGKYPNAAVFCSAGLAA